MNAASTGYIILNAALPTFVIMVVMSLRPKVLQQQGKRQHHAARHNKRQHVGDTAHQVAVVFAAQLRPVAGAEGVPAAVDGSLAGNGLFQQSVRVAHGIPAEA